MHQQERSKSSRRRTDVVGLPDQEATDHAYTVNVLRGCVDKMMKPRPDSRDNTHSFRYVRNDCSIQYPTSVNLILS